MNDDLDGIRELLHDCRDALNELVKIARARKTATADRPPARAVASARELDDPKYGDPTIKTAPRDWTGPFRSGQHMSECDPVLLDLLAERFEYFAQKNDTDRVMTDKGLPKSKYDRLAAAKARGWAARRRAGWTPPPPPTDQWIGPEFGDEDSRF